MSVSQELIVFISNCVSPFHAVAEFSALLEGEGFVRLPEDSPWALQAGRGYYVTRNGSSVIAFRVPDGTYRGFLLSAAHCDSPVLKLKENYQSSKLGAYTCANVEKYGGMLCAPWFDRPLSVAGRVMVRRDGGAGCRLVNIDRDLMVIPSLAIHMNRNANEGASYNPQTDMQPLMGSELAKDKLYALIGEQLGVAPGDILSADLFLYLRQRGVVAGLDGEYICAPRLDDLMCAYATAKGFLSSGSGGMIPMWCLFDNEEVGSSTKQGADSTFLQDVIERVNLCLGGDVQTLYSSIASSFMVSADNAHAIHPNHPEKYDGDNCCYMNRGIVIKHNANQKYTTDAYSAAVFKAGGDRAGGPVQTYSNRSDMPGGSTLGNISTRHVSLNTVDIGLAQLAMHSCYETAGAKDAEYLIRAMETYFRADYRCGRDGGFSI